MFAQDHPGRAVRIALIFMALLSCGAIPSAAPAAENDALTARLDALFDAAYPADAPGAAVRVQRGDDVLLRKGYGMADLELGVPIAPEMVFRLCSLTKQFTAVAVLMLAAQGTVDLDAPLGRYLPDYHGPGASATLHQLLAHTAGVPDYTDDPAFWETACLDRDLDALIATWQDKPQDFPPGSDWRYSNSGYVLLGKLIEVSGGTDYARFVAERLCAPLGLSSTVYDDAARILPGRVRGYDREGNGYRNTACVSMNLAHAAGALLSNVDDMVAWTDALFHGERLLPQAWRDRLLAPAVLADGRQTHFACGFEVLTLAGHAAVAHAGGGGGFAAYVAHVRDADLTCPQ